MLISRESGEISRMKVGGGVPTSLFEQADVALVAIWALIGKRPQLQHDKTKEVFTYGKCETVARNHRPREDRCHQGDGSQHEVKAFGST